MTGDSARIFDLSHPLEDGRKSYFRSVPHVHFFRARLGDVVRGRDVTVASDMMIASIHNGSHVDALGHVGSLAPGQDVNTRGGPGEVLPVFWARGCLLDVAGRCEQDGYQLTPGDMTAAESAAGLTVHRGDVVLVRTGWESRWGDDAAFGGEHADPPGLSLDAAAWLAEREVAAVGTDTPTLETKSTTMSVHRLLLTDSGIYIFESLRLAELATAEAAAFLFVATPLKMPGATGSPVRPLAITGHDPSLWSAASP